MKIRKTKKENVNIAECSIFQLFQIGTEQDQYRVETMTKHFEKLKDCETLDFCQYYATIKPSVKSLNHEHLRVGSLGGLNNTKLGITQDQNGFSTKILMF